ncbi:hypothetical protein TL16_g11029 [Triparma laevis f. inornata]|uniref:SH2 domain-containing protein n=1 Tax=Triparma laevis f. inornata TaxID=1714386 RepID=A0A9W7BCC3_9STRA|nr:hypothetical protein TL16_g11029 [Triparma laevis f. inornata]
MNLNSPHSYAGKPSGLDNSDFYAGNFGTCQSVSWPTFLKVAQNEIDRYVSSPPSAFPSADYSSTSSSSEHSYASSSTPNSSSKNSHPHARSTHLTPPPNEPNPHKKNRKNKPKKDIDRFQGSPMPASHSRPLTGSSTKAPSLPFDVAAKIKEVFEKHSHTTLSRVLRYTLLEPQRQEMEGASGERPHPYPPISYRSYERFVGRFGPIFHVACVRAAMSVFDNGAVRPWFHGTISRDTGDQLMSMAENGSYLVRFSEAKPKCLTLVYKGSRGRCKNIMIFNLGNCFGLTDASSKSGTPRSSADSVETFDTINDFLVRHEKLKYAVPSTLYKHCLDEMETEKLRSVVGKSDHPQHSSSDDDSEPEYMNADSSVIGVGVPTSLSLKIPPNPDPDVDSSDGEGDENNNVQERYIENLERPSTAKSPSSNFGHDVNDTLALKMSMLTSPPTPDNSKSPPPDFGIYGQTNINNHHLSQFSSTQESPYGSFGGAFPQSIPQSPARANKHSLPADSPYGSFGGIEESFLHSPPAHAQSADPHHQSSKKYDPNSQFAGESVNTQPTKTNAGPTSTSPTPNPPNLPPTHAEFLSYLESAQSALEEDDLDVSALLLRSLERLTRSSIFNNFPLAEPYMKQFRSLQNRLKSKQDSLELRDELVPEILDNAKHLATSGELTEALTLIIPHTTLSSPIPSTSPQLRAQAYRLRGDLNMLIFVNSQDFSNTTALGLDDPVDSPYLDSAEQSYLRSLTLAEKCMKKSKEMEETLAKIYGVKELKSFRPLTLLSHVGGDNSSPNFSYWNLSQANHIRLCDISRRRRNWPKFFKRKASVLSRTLTSSKRLEIITKMMAERKLEKQHLLGEDETDDEFTQWLERYAGLGIAESHFNKGMSTFSTFTRTPKTSPTHLPLLQTSITYFQKSLVSSLLSLSPLIEARASANLATCYHHAGESRKSVINYLKSCLAFRIYENNETKKVGSSEKRILNALTLRLNDVRDYRTSRVFCLVQLKVASSKSNVEVLKERLCGIDVKIRKGEEEEEEEAEEDDARSEVSEGSKRSVQRRGSGGKGGEEDDLPPGPPGG